MRLADSPAFWTGQRPARPEVGGRDARRRKSQPLLLMSFGSYRPKAMKRIAVVGATGTLGSAVVHALTHRGDEVIPLSRSSSPSLDIEQDASIRAALDVVGPIDALVCTTGRVNAAVEAFVRAAALDIAPIRILAVCPPRVRETAAAKGGPNPPGTPARQVAETYLAALESPNTGEVRFVEARPG